MSEPLPTPPPVLSTYLTELEVEMEGRDTLRPADLLRVARAIAQALEELGRHRETLKDTVTFVNELQARLLIVDDLPVDAPFGALIRLRNGTVAQRSTLYLGNGGGQPLSKLVPVAV